MVLCFIGSFEPFLRNLLFLLKLPPPLFTEPVLPVAPLMTASRARPMASR